MTKQFNIFGDIVSDGYKSNDSDVCLLDFQRFLETVNDGDDIELQICSCGGDVYQGIAISNLIRQYGKLHNCHTTAHIISLAASIASVIACACDDIVMDSNSVMMIHLPYTCDVTGNVIDLQKQIEQLNKCKDALISFYTSKFDLSVEEIEKLLENETWIDADNINDYKLHATVIPVDGEFRIAAKIVDGLQKFNNQKIIERFKAKMKMSINTTPDVTPDEEIKEVSEEVTKEEVTTEESTTEEETTEEVNTEEVTTEEATTEEETTEEVNTEEATTEEATTEEETTEEVNTEEATTEEATTEEEIKEEKPTYDELVTEIEKLKKEIDNLTSNKCGEDVEKRVSGMQSKMQAKINTITTEFNDKLDICNKELIDYRNQVTSLTAKINETEKINAELQSTVSALNSELTQKSQALATLNANVNSPKDIEKEIDFSTNPKGYLNWIDSKRKSI